MQKTRRGRPPGACADFRTDRYARAVVLLDAQLRFASLKPGSTTAGEASCKACCSGVQ
jgi:hypothetical protein